MPLQPSTARLAGSFPARYERLPGMVTVRPGPPSKTTATVRRNRRLHRYLLGTAILLAGLALLLLVLQAADQAADHADPAAALAAGHPAERRRRTAAAAGRVVAG